MPRIPSALLTVGAGAALAILADPVSGRRRRALLRDKVDHAARLFACGLATTGRDLAHRARGLAALARHVVHREAVTDDVLVERVRTQLGRVVSHPHAVEVAGRDGHVTLSGPILASESARLIRAARRVPGVAGIENRLEIHKQAADVPALQGGSGRRGARPELLQANWAPAPRVVVGTTGVGLAAAGIRRGGWLGAASMVAGTALASRAATNIELRRLIGTGGGRRAVDIQKTIWIGTPAERIFALWADIEQLPKLMSHVKEVRDLGNGRSHWIVEGPAGANVSWDAEIVDFVPHRVIAWRSVPGARVQSRGVVRFDPDRDGTRLSVRLSYNPPGGAIGHVIAALFRRDPRHQMHDDLHRLKSLLEVGKTSVRGRVVRVEDLRPHA